MSYNTIKIKKYSDVVEELTATAVAIYPGMLVELTSADTVQAHSNAGRNALQMFALEDEMQGNGIDTAYAVSVPIQVWIPGRGDQVYAILADGQNAAIGDFLESNGDGYLKVHVPDIAVGGSSLESVTDMNVYTNQIVGVCLEAANLSGSSGVGSEESVALIAYNRRIKVRII